MDQLIRSTELGSGSTLGPAETRRGARRLGRVSAVLGIAACLLLLIAGVVALGDHVGAAVG